MRSTTAASTAIVSPPRIGIDESGDDHLQAPEHEAGQCERQERSAGDHHEHEGADQPGHPHIRIDAGQRRDQCAGSAARPLPMPKVTRRTRALSMPRPCASISFMITARVERPRRVPLSSPENISATTRSPPPPSTGDSPNNRRRQDHTVPAIGAGTNWTSRPKTSVTICPITMLRPQVARMASSGRL